MVEQMPAGFLSATPGVLACLSALPCTVLLLDSLSCFSSSSSQKPNCRWLRLRHVASVTDAQAVTLEAAAAAASSISTALAPASSLLLPLLLALQQLLLLLLSSDISAMALTSIDRDVRMEVRCEEPAEAAVEQLGELLAAAMGALLDGSPGTAARAVSVL
jgi:uncharacterized membrane protein YbaN (DUF454 family)